VEAGGVSDLQQALEDMREARQIHAHWCEWLGRHPEFDASDVGDAEHHELWVGKYDNVLAVIEGIVP
jgi:hypothetical protein